MIVWLPYATLIIMAFIIIFMVFYFFTRGRIIKKETIYSIVFLIMVIIIVIGVGFIVLRDVSEIPFKLCENKEGLVINPEQDYIFYDCDKVNNITISLGMFS